MTFAELIEAGRKDRCRTYGRDVRPNYWRDLRIAALRRLDNDSDRSGDELRTMIEAVGRGIVSMARSRKEYEDKDIVDDVDALADCLKELTAALDKKPVPV